MEKKIIDTKFLNSEIKVSVFDDYKTICIESPTGTGKTTIICDYLKKKNFISLVLLESLANQQYDNFKKNKVDCKHYKNGDELKFDDDIIITLQSLNKLIKNVKKEELIKQIKGKTLFIDEISLFASGIINNDTIVDLRRTYSFLKVLINHCGRLIVCQNEINDHAKILIESRKGNTLFIKNKYVNFNGHQATKMNSEDDFIELMDSNVKNKEYFCCASDSLNKINQYYTKLSSGRDKNEFLLLTSETKTKINSIEDLKNKYIFYSPSISYGIDITMDEKMNMYQYFGGKSIDDSMIFQQSMRVRNLKRLYFYTDATERKRKYNSIEDVKQNYDVMINTEFMNMCSYFNEDDEIKINTESSYYKLFVESVFYNDKVFSNVEAYYVERLENSGFTIKQKGDKKKISKETKAEIKKEIETNKDDKFNNFLEETDERRKALYEPFANRAEVLNLTKYSDREEQKKIMRKFKDEIIDDHKLKKHLNFCKLMQQKKYSELKFEKKIENKFKVEMCHDVHYKVLFLKKIEEKFNINMLNIECKDGKIEFDEKDHDEIKRIFNIREKKSPSTYIELISLYVKMVSSIAGDDVFTSKKSNKRDYTKDKLLHTLNKDKMEYHLELCKIRNNKLKHLEQYAKDLCDDLEWETVDEILEL